MEKTTKFPAIYRVAEVKLTFRSKPSERPQVTWSTDSYKMLKESRDTGKIEFVDQFKVLLLNRANRILGIFEVSTGGVAGTVASSSATITLGQPQAQCSRPAADPEDEKRRRATRHSLIESPDPDERNVLFHGR